MPRRAAAAPCRQILPRWSAQPFEAAAALVPSVLPCRYPPRPPPCSCTGGTPGGGRRSRLRICPARPGAPPSDRERLDRGHIFPLAGNARRAGEPSPGLRAPRCCPSRYRPPWRPLPNLCCRLAPAGPHAASDIAAPVEQEALIRISLFLVASGAVGLLSRGRQAASRLARVGAFLPIFAGLWQSRSRTSSRRARNRRQLRPASPARARPRRRAARRSSSSPTIRRRATSRPRSPNWSNRPRRASATRCCSASPDRARPSPWPR